MKIILLVLIMFIASCGAPPNEEVPPCVKINKPVVIDDQEDIIRCSENI